MTRDTRWTNIRDSLSGPPDGQASSDVTLIAPLIGLVTGALAGVVPALKAAQTSPATTPRSSELHTAPSCVLKQ